MIKLEKQIHPQTIFINESGLYSPTLSSRMSTAKKFKYWITHTVIPSLRKYGVYEIENNEKNENEKLKKIIKDKIKLIKQLEKNQKKEKYPNGGIIYVMRPYPEEDFLKIGISDIMNERVGSYGTSFPNKTDILYWFASKSPKQIELCLRAGLYIYRYGPIKKEMFKCKLKKVINTINNCKNILPRINTKMSREEENKFNEYDMNKEYVIELDFDTDSNEEQKGGNSDSRIFKDYDRIFNNELIVEPNYE